MPTTKKTTTKKPTTTKMKGVGTGNNPNSRKGVKNLKVPTSEEARKNGAAGGKKSQAKQRAIRNCREAAKDILAMSTINAAGITSLKRKGVDMSEFEDMQNAYALMLGLFAEGMKGNANCAKLFLEMAGELTEEDKAAEDNAAGVIFLAPVMEKTNE